MSFAGLTMTTAHDRVTGGLQRGQMALPSRETAGLKPKWGNTAGDQSNMVERATC